MLELRTFGGLSIEAQGTPWTGAPAQRKTLALLALLAGHPRGLSRDKLIAYLWPETDATHGRNLLRQGCYALRRDLHEDNLFLGSTELRLNPAALTSDVQAFEDALQRGDLAQAIDLHAGPFLDGFYLSESNEFERWVEAERGRLTKRVCAALETLATEAAARGDYRCAAERWRQLAALDSVNSRAALGLVTALAARGEVAEALQHGRAYEALVRQELGTAPVAAIIDLTSRLRLEPAAAEGVTTDELRLGETAGARRRTVGYEKERAALRASLEAAIKGRGSMLCISGEPGSGKTTLVEDFLGELLVTGRPCHIARGRCSERLAGSGAYLPLLDALEGLLRSDPRGTTTTLMHQLAPNWYAQVAPSLQQGTSQGRAPQMQAASQERLKRELNALFRELCRLRPLIVFFDDVHWADVSTTDILGYVANQMGTAQMVIVATYRPSELQFTKHPFGPVKLELQGHGLCRDLPLELLTREDIEQFLKLEFPDHRFPPTFAGFVHAKTEGSPLFLVDLLRYLRAKQVIVAENGGWKLAGSLPDLERELPESVRSMIDRKIEQLDESDLRLLGAAGVQGVEFDSPVVSEVLDVSPADVEERLDALDRIHGFVRPLRELEFPDGTRGVRYRFVHALYQNALYARLSPTRRTDLSRAIAQALLSHYGDQKTDVAAELALLFEVARDIPRAVEHFTIAAQNATGLFAYREAVALARRGLELVRTLSDTAERAGRELALQLTLGFALHATYSAGNLVTGECMKRARDLCRQLGEPPALFPAMLGLWSYYLVSSEQQAARETAERLLAMAEEVHDPVCLFGAHTVLGASLTHMAEHTAGLAHLQRAGELYDPRQRETYISLYRQDLGVYCGCEIERTLWLVGYPEQARRQMERMLALAREAADPQATAFALIFAAILHQCRGQPEAAQEEADALIALCDEHGMGGHREWGMCIRGWALAEQGLTQDGLDLMRERIDALRAKNILAGVDYFLGVSTQILNKVGDVPKGLASLGEAFDVARSTNQPVWLAEFARLRGELLVQDGAAEAEAEASLREALTIARRQEAKSLELRAATSLARLWQRQGKKEGARELLASVYGWFTEGFDTADLREAKGLLDALV